MDSQATGEVTDIFCHCKTRSDKPFFLTPEKMPWDGAVLGLIPNDNCKSTFKSKKAVVDWLNDQPWEELGFLQPDGRYKFSQRSLSSVWLRKPENL